MSPATETAQGRGYQILAFSIRGGVVLNLHAQGNTKKPVAAELGFSENLIKQELVRIFDKLSTKDRAHAVMPAIERGEQVAAFMMRAFDPSG